jgi:hypothetical protein
VGARRSPRFTELPRAGRQRISPYVLRLSAQMLVSIKLSKLSREANTSGQMRRVHRYAPELEKRVRAYQGEEGSSCQPSHFPFQTTEVGQLNSGQGCLREWTPFLGFEE